MKILSGGEKAFVAIALYFAIMKVRPTPFCMLDEIDAALDDRNVGRFAAYLRNLSSKTQFIVITHRRGTMEAADVLYGVMFGGGGWVLFHKPPGNDFEVYNDFNGLLVNLYRCVRDKPEELMETLRYVLNAREDFDRIRSALARDSPASDVQRAAWFYQLIRYSYASGLTSFGSQPHDMRSNFSLIEQAHRRLAKVVIENKDFEKLLHQYDRPVSFFYLDPPYHATEGYYQNIGEDGFTEADHIRLRDALMRIEGKFLLSYNDDAFVRGLYDRPGIYLMETTRINNIKQRYDNGAQFPELIAS